MPLLLMDKGRAGEPTHEKGREMFARVALTAAILAGLAATPVAARELAFTAALRGDRMPTMTGSKATGQARIVVNTDTQAVDVSMTVDGLKVQSLWKTLVPTPMGPIHLHVYGSHDHSNPDSAALLFPAPYGAAYADTATGFRVEMKAAPYADGAARVNSRATFADFIGAMQAGRIVLNIHTNQFTDGEISGDVVPAA